MYASAYSRYVKRGAARSYPSLSLFLAGGRSLCLAPHCTDYISPDRRAIETEGEWPLRYLQRLWTMEPSMLDSHDKPLLPQIGRDYVANYPQNFILRMSLLGL